jgi:Fe-S cluster assembly ATP-binding protein
MEKNKNSSFLLEIQNLHANIENKEILKDFSLKINSGEIHVIMGPNGCGKSTLAKILAGHSSYQIKEGSILFKGIDFLKSSAEDRAKEGLFLAFQYPLEIEGVSNFDFLHLIYNEKKKYIGGKELTPLEFLSYLDPICEKLKIKKDFLYRNLNEGFSGGEKKKNEILQMFILDPDLIILDELDSGLDIDALKLIFEYISEYKNSKKSFLIISHSFKIFDYLKPDFINVMLNGQIVKQGHLELVDLIEKKGYNFFVS